MRKLMGLGVCALALTALPTLVLAQSPCGCGGSVQSYQRYSYQPAQATVVAPSAPVVASQPATVAAPAQVATAPVVSQNYRRFSYQPQARSNYRSNFEIPKGDTRRYTH